MQALERVQKALEKTTPGAGRYAKVIAGDVRAVNGKRDLPDELKPLAMGIAELPDSKVVFQPADLLSQLVELVGQ